MLELILVLIVLWMLFTSTNTYTNANKNSDVGYYLGPYGTPSSPKTGPSGPNQGSHDTPQKRHQNHQDGILGLVVPYYEHQNGSFHKWEVPFLGSVVEGSYSFGSKLGAPDLWKLPNKGPLRALCGLIARSDMPASAAAQISAATGEESSAGARTEVQASRFCKLSVGPSEFF